MKHMKLWDLANSRKIYIKIKEPLRGELFRYLFKIYGSMYKFAKVINMHPRQLWAYRKGERSISLFFLKNILQLCHDNSIRQKFMRSIEKNIEILKYGWCGKCIKNPIFPIEFSETLCRVIGHIVGDGGIRCKPSFTVQYANKDQQLVETFKRDVIKVFGEIEPYNYYYKKKNAFVVLFPSIVGYILTRFIGKQTKEHKHVPKLITNSNKKCKSIFLRALFDDEACISITVQRIEIQMCGKKLIEDIKTLLDEFGIKSRKIYKTEGKENWRPRYKIIISGEINLQKFNRKIGFESKDKKEKLELLLKRYRSKLNIEKLRDEILETLIENGKMSLFSLTKELPYSGLKYTLENLEKKGVINSRIIKGNFKGVLKVYSIR